MRGGSQNWSIWCPPGHEPLGRSGWSEQHRLPHLSLQTLQTLFSAPRLGEPGARAPLFTPETDKLRLDSPFPLLGSGKGLGSRGCRVGVLGKRMGRDRMQEGGGEAAVVCVCVCVKAGGFAGRGTGRGMGWEKGLRGC